MKTTHFFALAAMMVASTLGASAQVINETRNLEPFSMVSVSNAMDATIKYGDVQSVVVTAHADVIKNVRTEVNGPELTITFDDDKKFHKILKNKKFKMEVVVTVPVLNPVKASGASDVSVHATDEIVIDSTGASDVDYYGNPKVVDINAAGSSDVNGH